MQLCSHICCIAIVEYVYLKNVLNFLIYNFHRFTCMAVIGINWISMEKWPEILKSKSF